MIDKKYIDEAGEQTLLNLSRYVLNEFVKNSINEFNESKLKSFQITEQLKQKLGVFVTLKKGEELRGCIGYILGENLVYKNVIENTINASSRDPRFRKVKPDELSGIDIEISIMTPLTKISSLDEITVGRDGLLLRKGWNSGLLLPQVPLEWGWDKKTYLEQLSKKAGLPADGYLDESAEIHRFSAQVFGEKSGA